jgi:hypothetical protein
VRHGGLGIYDPTTTTESSYEASSAGVKVLVEALKRGDGLLDREAHRECVTGATHHARTLRREQAVREHSRIREELLKSDEGAVRAIDRAVDNGLSKVLMTPPCAHKRFVLNANEMRDHLAQRYNMEGAELAAYCPCGKPISIPHAQCCKRGGLVTLRHDIFQDELGDMMVETGTKQVHRHPLIRTPAEPQQPPPGLGGDGREGEREGGKLSHWEVKADFKKRGGLVGDLSACGFYTRGTTSVFDIRVSYPDAPSYVNDTAEKLLEMGEKAKHKKYHTACALRGAKFVPLIVTTDGVMGGELQACMGRLIDRYAQKWQTEGDVTATVKATATQYVKARLAFALAKGWSMCIRGQREKWGHAQREGGRGEEEDVQYGQGYIVVDAAEARAAVE